MTFKVLLTCSLKGGMDGDWKGYYERVTNSLKVTQSRIFSRDFDERLEIVEYNKEFIAK
jgi:hypothetical protein